MAQRTTVYYRILPVNLALAGRTCALLHLLHAASLLMVTLDQTWQTNRYPWNKTHDHTSTHKRACGAIKLLFRGGS